MKKLFLLLPLLCSLVHASELSLLEEEGGARKAALILDVLAPKECESTIQLKRYSDKFALAIDEEEREIPNYMVSKPLRQMEPQQLAAFLKANYISINECSDGSFSLEGHGRIHGGGAFGAWLGSAIGFAAVHAGAAAVAGVIAAPVAVINPIAGGAVYAGVSKVTHALATPLAYSVAVGTGMAGAVATGPV